MKFKFILAAGVFALASQVQAAPVNLVQNGSFEDDVITSGSWGHFDSITDWTTGQGNKIEIRNDAVGQAYDGVNFVELDSTKNSNIFQTIATTAGQAYTLSFAYSPRTGQAADTNGIEVYWGETLIPGSSITAVGTTNGTNDWNIFTFTVMGTGTDTLTFAATGKSDSFGGGIDDISLVSAVPIPAAAFLFAPALLGFMGLRRKTKNVVAA